MTDNATDHPPVRLRHGGPNDGTEGEQFLHRAASVLAATVLDIAGDPSGRTSNAALAMSIAASAFILIAAHSRLAGMDASQIQAGLAALPEAIDRQLAEMRRQQARRSGDVAGSA